MSEQQQPPVKGWRVRASFNERGWRREKTEAFFNPSQEKCLANIQLNIELWHPDAEDIQLEIVGPVPQANWGSGTWVDSFRKETL